MFIYSDVEEFMNHPMDAVFLAHRSLLEEGVPYDIPDFRKEEDRVKWEKDTLNPCYGPNGEEPTLPCCSHPDYKPMESQLNNYLEAIKTRE